MTFSELCYDARRLVTDDGTSTAYSTTDLTYSINRALEKVTSLIREAQGRWQFDDSNDTDFPIATTALVASQQDYALDGTSHFRIERVELKSTSGNWSKLIPFDQIDVYNQPISGLLTTPGNPAYYDKIGNSLFLYPAPNYAQAASLKLYFERGPAYFLTTDTIKTPGFNPLYHRYLSLVAAHDYALIHELPVQGGIIRGGFKTGLVAQISDMEDDIATYYSLRDVDDRPRLKARTYNLT